MQFGKKTALVAAIALGTLAARVQSAVIYSVTGSTYSQNFDTLPITPENATLQATIPWKDDTAPSGSNSGIVGWYLYHTLDPGPTENGTSGHNRLRITSGNTTTGSFYSFGTTAATDRALGDIGSTTIASNPPGVQDIYTALRITNSTSDVLTDLVITYTGEQWRNNGNAATDSIFFAYSLDPLATVNSGTYTSDTNLTFVSPIHTATAAALDGNAAANRQVLTDTITGLNWAPGTDLWLRWDDLQISGNDHALGIDDFSITATANVVAPEPTALALLALVPLVAGRRRSR